FRVIPELLINVALLFFLIAEIILLYHQKVFGGTVYPSACFSFYLIVKLPVNPFSRNLID
ncbi:MAG TPA: hypothetical protein VLJ41_08845, partial [Segetibacter sp.]|nr:hypothetical protein [Segetibacter sp.]